MTCRARLPRLGREASRAGCARLLAHPGHSGEASTGPRSVPGGWHTPAFAPAPAPPSSPRHVAATSARRAARAGAGRGTAARPAVERPLARFPHALGLPGDERASAMRHPRDALSSLSRGLARGMTIESMDIVGHSACLCHRTSRAGRGVAVDGDGRGSAQTVLGPHDPTARAGPHGHASGGDGCHPRLR